MILNETGEQLSKKLPFVSILMPVRNEESYIERSIRSVIEQDYPHDLMEIILADGRSTDQTKQVIQDFQDQYAKIHLIDNPGMIVPTGMNLAIQKAKGEILIRVDGHCEIDKDYVKNCVEILKDPGIHGVGGPMETIGETFTAKAIAIAMSSFFGVGGSAFRTINNKKIFVETVPFPAYRKDTVQAAGPYDEEMVRNQDDEYNYRLLELGGKILLAPEIRSRYYSRSSLRKLWRQYFQYGYWKVRVMQKHRGQMKLRQFAPPLFVLSVLTGLVLLLFLPEAWFIFVFSIFLYIVASLTAAIISARQYGWKYFLILMIIFPILHFSYGLGFLIGMVKFAGRWQDVTHRQSGREEIR